MNKVSVVDVDNFINLLAWSAKQDVSIVSNYIIEPLKRSADKIADVDVENFTKNLEVQKKMANWKIVGNIYRKLLNNHVYQLDHKPLVELLSLLMIDFQASPKLLLSPFAVEIFNVYETSIKGLQSLYTESVNGGFNSALKENTTKVKAISINTDISVTRKKKLNLEAEQMFRRIEQVYAMGDMNRLSYFLAQFTGRFCNFPGVNHREDVDLIIEKMCEQDQDFQREVKNRLSIRIYRGIAQSINKGDIKKAVRGIATFVLTFQDDMEVAYRSELDALEEKLYAYISKHNLWSRLKVKN